MILKICSILLLTVLLAISSVGLVTRSELIEVLPLAIKCRNRITSVGACVCGDHNGHARIVVRLIVVQVVGVEAAAHIRMPLALCLGEAHSHTHRITHLYFLVVLLR